MEEQGAKFTKYSHQYLLANKLYLYKKVSQLTASPGCLDERCSLSLRMLPMTVTSRHSPGLTPDSKVPVGRMKAMPLVVSPSCSELGIFHMGAFACTKQKTP